MRVEIQVIRKQKLLYHQLSERIFSKEHKEINDKKRQGNDREEKIIIFLKVESLDVLRWFIPNFHGQYKINVWKKTNWSRQRGI